MTSLKQQDTTWMNGASPTPTSTAAACRAARTGASRGCWVGTSLHWTSERSHKKTLFLFREIRLQSSSLVGIRASLLPAVKKALKVPRSTTSETRQSQHRCSRSQVHFHPHTLRWAGQHPYVWLPRPDRLSKNSVTSTVSGLKCGESGGEGEDWNGYHLEEDVDKRRLNDCAVCWIAWVLFSSLSNISKYVTDRLQSHQSGPPRLSPSPFQDSSLSNS